MDTPNFFTGLECPICTHPLIISSIMSDGTFIHKKCAEQYFSQTINPKSLTTNELLESTKLIPNNYTNRMFKQYIERTDTFNNYFQTITPDEIEHTDLTDFIMSNPKIKQLLSPDTFDKIRPTNTKIHKQIAYEIISLICAKQEDKIFEKIHYISLNHPTFDFSQIYEGDNTLLNYACEKNLTQFSLWLINTQKININNVNKRGDTPLLWATYKNNPEIANSLIQNGAEIHHIDSKYSSALTWACKNKMTDTMFLIFNTYSPNYIRPMCIHTTLMGIHNNNSPIMWACINNMESVVTFMLTHFSDNSHELINNIGYNGNSMLTTACRNNNHIIVSKLLEHPDININYTVGRMSSLMIACKNKNSTIVSKLLEHPNINVNYTNDNDNNNTSALHIAQNVQNATIIILLLGHKNINISEYPHIQSLLFWACHHKHADIILRILSDPIIDKKIIESRDNHNKTIMYYAQKNNMVTIINYLKNIHKIRRGCMLFGGLIYF